MAHRPQHKNACKKRAAELFDEELFKDPPDQPECPICMLPLPIDENRIKFQLCCKQTLCMGCVHAQIKEERKSGKRREEIGACAFCGAPALISDDESNKALKTLAERNNVNAMNMIATYYIQGRKGFPKDANKAIEMYLKAAKLGYPGAYHNLGNIFYAGDGVERDVKKARHYYELGTIQGSFISRHNLASFDWKDGHHERASKHFLINAKAGFELSLNAVKKCFENGFVTKDQYAEVLRAYQKKQEDSKSAMREETLVYEANPELYLQIS